MFHKLRFLSVPHQITHYFQFQTNRKSLVYTNVQNHPKKFEETKMFAVIFIIRLRDSSDWTGKKESVYRV